MDVHDFLTEDDWAFFNSIRDDLHRLEYATVEYYKSAPVLLDQLQLLRVGTSDIIVTDEPWDSDFFGRAIGSLAVRRLDDEVVEYALKRCEERGIECLYYTCDRSDKNSQRLATEHGFSKVDSRLIFRHDLGDIHGVSTEGVEVSEAVSSDVEELKRIARSVYSRTRFYRDDHFPDEACDELYATWIENAYEGFADVVTVARSNDGRPLGFVTCDLDDGTGEIGLVGVDAGVQGSGIGTTLVSDALRWFVERGADCATVATQAKNEAAVGLYERCGFERSRSEAIFHRWFNSA